MEALRQDGTAPRDFLMESLQLPPLRPHSAELLHLLRQPVERIDVRRLAHSIESDPLLAARLLRNSPVYGVRRGVARVGQALVVLGLDEALALLNYFTLRGNFVELPPATGFNVEAFWRHSLDIATAARLLGHPDLLVRTLPGDLFTAGLLHDIGKLVMATFLADRYRACLELCRRSTLPEHVAEQQLLGFHHAVLGAQLLDSWNLPCHILDCIACHHAPDQADPSNREAVGLLQYAHLLTNLSPDEPAESIRVRFDTLWLVRTMPHHPLAAMETFKRLARRVQSELQRKRAALAHVEAQSPEPEEEEPQASTGRAAPSIAPARRRIVIWHWLRALFSG